MAQVNQGQSDEFHTQVRERDARSSQEAMPDIDEHEEEGAVEGDRVPVEPIIRHHRVFYEITLGSGAVKNSESTGMTHKKSHRRWTRYTQVDYLGRG